MTDGMDRDELIGLLGQLGDDDDQTVLAAARAIHAKVTDSGQSWDTLLARTAPANDDEPAFEADGEDPEPIVATGPVPDDAEALRLIERLLATPGISEELRGELDDYKADLAAGEFGDADRRYLRALYQRLVKS